MGTPRARRTLFTFPRALVTSAVLLSTAWLTAEEFPAGDAHPSPLAGREAAPPSPILGGPREAPGPLDLSPLPAAMGLSEAAAAQLGERLEADPILLGEAVAAAEHPDPGFLQAWARLQAIAAGLDVEPSALEPS
jgi:hypothetical protein